jgi:hypothetical protein
MVSRKLERGDRNDKKRERRAGNISKTLLFAIFKAVSRIQKTDCAVFKHFGQPNLFNSIQSGYQITDALRLLVFAFFPLRPLRPGLSFFPVLDKSD